MSNTTAYESLDDAHMVRYLTSILTLYPGDEVVIETEGIGVLKTPMRAATRAKQ